MTTFKVGDKVRYLNNDIEVGFGKTLLATNNRFFTVSYIATSNVFTDEQLIGVNGAAYAAWRSKAFELVERAIRRDRLVRVTIEDVTDDLNNAHDGVCYTLKYALPTDNKIDVVAVLREATYQRSLAREIASDIQKGFIPITTQE